MMLHQNLSWFSVFNIFRNVANARKLFFLPEIIILDLILSNLLETVTGVGFVDALYVNLICRLELIRNCNRAQVCRCSVKQVAAGCVVLDL